MTPEAETVAYSVNVNRTLKMSGFEEREQRLAEVAGKSLEMAVDVLSGLAAGLKRAGEKTPRLDRMVNGICRVVDTADSDGVVLTVCVEPVGNSFAAKIVDSDVSVSFGRQPVNAICAALSKWADANPDVYVDSINLCQVGRDERGYSHATYGATPGK
jgi:hypothetical protein